jgi:hypothetical protein
MPISLSEGGEPCSIPTVKKFETGESNQTVLPSSVRNRSPKLARAQPFILFYFIFLFFKLCFIASLVEAVHTGALSVSMPSGQLNKAFHS